MAKETQYTILNKNELPNNELELEIEIPADVLESFNDDALKALGEDVELDGFRKGHAPKDMVLKTVGEMAVIERAAYAAINTVYPVILTKEKINALTQPQISITKIAPKDSLVFKAKLSLMPTVELPDYKKIAKGVAPITKEEVTDKEVDTYIDFIRSQRAQMMQMNGGQKSEDTDETAGEKNNSSTKEADTKKEPELPELNDEFVKTLGDFKDVADFKAKLKENMQKEKEQKEVERRRLEIIEGIITDAKIELPEVLVTEELDRMVAEFKDRIKSMKMEPDAYFKEIKKSEEDLRAEWKTDATKRVKMNLVLPKIAEAEKIEVDQEIVQKEIVHLKEHHKEIDEFRARVYITNLLANEEVFKFLEKIS